MFHGHTLKLPVDPSDILSGLFSMSVPVLADFPPTASERHRQLLAQSLYVDRHVEKSSLSAESGLGHEPLLVFNQTQIFIKCTLMGGRRTYCTVKKSCCYRCLRGPFINFLSVFYYTSTTITHYTKTWDEGRSDCRLSFS